jgi:hypothetical protein
VPQIDLGDPGVQPQSTRIARWSIERSRAALGPERRKLPATLASRAIHIELRRMKADGLLRLSDLIKMALKPGLAAFCPRSCPGGDGTASGKARPG